MYKCPGNGSKGILVVNISNLTSIEYVMVKAIDAAGEEHTTRTTSQEDNQTLRL